MHQLILTMFAVLELNLLIYWTVHIVLHQVPVVDMKVSLELSADQVSKLKAAILLL